MEAVLPPKILVDMRNTYLGHPPDTVPGRALAADLAANPIRFIDKLTKLESDWALAQSKAAPVKVEGDSSVPVGSGSARCIAVAEEWLAKNGVKR